MIVDQSKFRFTPGWGNFEEKKMWGGFEEKKMWGNFKEKKCEATSKKKKCAHEVCSGDEDSNSDSEDELCQNIMDSESENSCYWKFLLLKILATE